MTDALPIYLDFDPTGTLSSNYIKDEPHELYSIKRNLIKPQYAPFHRKDLALYSVDDAGASTVLVSGIDYQCTDLLVKETQKWGSEMFSFIAVLKENLPTNILICYRAVGGEQNGNVEAALERISSTMGTDITVAWSDVKDKPSGYTPKPHKQDVEDLYGLEFFKGAIQHVKQSILGADDCRKSIRAKQVVSLVKEWDDIRRRSRHMASNHIVDYMDPHLLTKKQIDLEAVEDIDFHTPLGINTELDTIDVSTIANHVKEFGNLHNTTAEQLGLERVLNYPVTKTTKEGLNDTADEYVTVGSLSFSAPIHLADCVKAEVAGNSYGLSTLNDTIKVNAEQIPYILKCNRADLHGFYEGTPGNSQLLFAHVVVADDFVLMDYSRSMVACAIAPTYGFRIDLIEDNLLIGYFLFRPNERLAFYQKTVGNDRFRKIMPNKTLRLKCQRNIDPTIKDITFGLFIGQFNSTVSYVAADITN